MIKSHRNWFGNSSQKVVLCSFVVLLAQGISWAQNPDEAKRKRISVFGSSVASGSAAKGRQGYWHMLKEAIAERGWQVSSCSRGGDRTTRILDRFDSLVTQKPDYVLIGLSLANEGIRKGNTDAERAEVYRQYEQGIRGLIDLMRENNMTPVVGLCYPHGHYTAEQHLCVKRMNLLINSWNAPSVNFLGAIGDGQGRWGKAYENDPGHPNTAGHREMFYAIVPSLFDALEAGKPIPKKAVEGNAIELGKGPGRFVTHKPTDPIHSWSTAFSVLSAHNGTLQSIRARGGCATVSLEGGKFVYRSSKGECLVSGASVADNQWHDIAVAHRYAHEQTEFYVDGKPIGSTMERVEPLEIHLAGENREQASFRDWFIYRAALNDLEVEAIHQGQLLQASLEVYAPLRDTTRATGTSLENRAQSLSQVVLLPL